MCVCVYKMQMTGNVKITMISLQQQKINILVFQLVWLIKHIYSWIHNISTIQFGQSAIGNQPVFKTEMLRVDC